MIWEVDEDLDHMVSWEEFRLMYTPNLLPLCIFVTFCTHAHQSPAPAYYCNTLHMYQRVRTDKTGLEARKLYNVVDFVMHDNDVDGYVTLDDCFAIMFMRHGKNFGEEDIKKLFK